jgi:1-aminocyclopropane-1-carboxylate deaminase/D-cysteine desulfhydrase-like pyridoxal-dependent ACC family enzyme
MIITSGNMAIDFSGNVRIDYLKAPLFDRKNIRLGLLRLDEIHPLISGNKWFKLKENIRLAQQQGREGLLTFGGAYSNHLVATAAAAKLSGLSSIGFIRGLHARHPLTDTLKECSRQGMELQFLERAEYALKSTKEYLEDVQERYPGFLVVPEGGNNPEGLAGVAAIANLIPPEAGLVVLPVGTGATFSGLRNALGQEIEMLGFAPFKNGAYLEDVVRDNLYPGMSGWRLCMNFHFGGFARHQPELIAFINEFYREFQIPLDFVYTAKMMFGLLQMIKKEELPENIHIIALHTGGLQGNCSIRHLLEF